MNKNFVEVPKNDFDKVIFVANLTAELTGKPVSKEQLLKSIKERNFDITEKQLEFIELNFK